MKKPLHGAVGAVLLLAAAAACAPADESEPDAAGATSAASCADGLPGQTKSDGTLTVGTDKPAYSPWFDSDDPANGKGFESAVAYAVAQELGFPKDKVKWVTASFNTVIAPGAKPYDVDINQASITEERRQAVDFSSGYYDVAQAVVAVKGGKAENARSVADLRGVKLGAQVGTTSYRTITDVIRPTTQAAVFDDNDKAKLALQNGQVDAVVFDLPTALYLVAAELDGGLLLGQFANREGEQPEQFGMVLEKGSPITSCVTEAVDALREDGTLDRLEQQWLTTTAGAPVLR